MEEAQALGDFLRIVSRTLRSIPVARRMVLIHLGPAFLNLSITICLWPQGDPKQWFTVPERRSLAKDEMLEIISWRSLG